MKRALMILPLLAVLLFFAIAGSAEESYPASCLVKFTDNPPAELAEALAASPWAGAVTAACSASRTSSSASATAPSRSHAARAIFPPTRW